MSDFDLFTVLVDLEVEVIKCSRRVHLSSTPTLVLTTKQRFSNLADSISCSDSYAIQCLSRRISSRLNSSELKLDS